MGKRKKVATSTAPEGLGDQHWYKLPADSPRAHELVVPFGMALQRHHEPQQQKNRARERIYEGLDVQQNRAAVMTLEQLGVGIARLNATKSIIDTFVSRLAKDRPMPSFVVNDGDFLLKQRSRKYRNFIISKMNDTEYDDLARESLLDSSILGNGFTRIDDGENDVFAERIPANEMLFDPRECRYGKPQSAMRLQRVSRDYLIELFPDHKDPIRNAANSVRRPDDKESDGDQFSNLEDYVDVFTAWHLPSTPDSEDGRCFVCLENVTLSGRVWLEPRFPWGHNRIFRPRRGLLGHGFVDQLASLQHRVNCIVRDLQLNLAATGRGHFLVNEQNDIPVEQLTGWQPFKLKFKGGQPPVYQAPQPFNQAQLNALIFFIDQMFDLTGVSKANATSKSALGPGASGVALDTQYDIDSDRFRMPQSNNARYRLDCAQLYIDAAARVARRREEDKGKKRSYVAVSWKSRDAIEQLEYDKVMLKEGQYRLQIEASNFLPDTRAGKLAVVEQLAKAGVIPQWLVPTLFDEPDLAQANNIMLAGLRNAFRKADELVDEELPAPIPEVFNDLELELKVMTAFYNHYQNEKATEGVQDRFRTYIGLIKHTIKLQNPSTGMPEPQAMPGGAAMPPPGAPVDPAMAPAPGGVPAMPTGPVPMPMPIGAV